MDHGGQYTGESPLEKEEGDGAGKYTEDTGEEKKPRRKDRQRKLLKKEQPEKGMGLEADLPEAAGGNFMPGAGRNIRGAYHPGEDSG